MSMLPNHTVEIPLDKINLGTSQSRQRDTRVDGDDDIVCSIRKDGLLNPIIVTRLEDGNYGLISGQRRYLAHKTLDREKIKAYVVEGNVDSFEAKKLSLVENAARKDMKRADYVDTIQIFMERYGSTKTVAKELGLSSNTVRRYVRIGRLPSAIQEKIRAKEITLDNALRALDILGGDEETVDEPALLSIAAKMRPLSHQAKGKFAEIKKEIPDMDPTKAADLAKKMAELNQFTINVSDDQLSRIDKYKQNESLDKTEDAAVQLIDLGLESAGA